jgi:hypothetical protein
MLYCTDLGKIAKNHDSEGCKRMLAPEKFAEWISKHEHKDANYGYVYNYHPRSDAHSIALCNFVLDDLLDTCQLLREQAERGEIAYGINIRFKWPSTSKSKTLDLAIGTPADHAFKPFLGQRRIAKVDHLADVFFSCEAKSVMTEHNKSKPRVYDELSSSYGIVHQGTQEAIAAGITVVNVANTFISPLRQRTSELIHISQHKQPAAAASVVEHLRGLPIRQNVGEVGFDAYATIIVDCNNQGPAHLWTAFPAPQPGERDYYETFLSQICHAYTERFSNIHKEWILSR